MRATKQLYSQVDETGNVVAERLHLVPGMKLPQGHTWVPFITPVSEIKSRKRSEINSNRSSARIAPVTLLGKEWQADKTSSDLLVNTILLVSLDIIPVPTIWRSLDNTNVEVTLQDLKSIAALIAINTQDAYTKSWQLKDSINSATTVEDISAITW